MHDASQSLDFSFLEQRVAECCSFQVLFELFAAHNSSTALNKALYSLLWAFTEVKGEVTPVTNNMNRLQVILKVV